MVFFAPKSAPSSSEAKMLIDAFPFHLPTIVEVENLVSDFPNSPEAWKIGAYALYHHAGMDRAREFLARGTKLIDPRKRNERCAVWKDLITLEAHFGTSEMLFATFDEALIYHEARKIHMHMLDTLIEAKKTEELKSFKDKILNNYGAEKKVYYYLLEHFMSHGAKREARSVFDKSLNCLPEKDHAEIVRKFKTLERRFGPC